MTARQDDDQGAPRRRLRAFGIHLIGYFVVMLIVVLVNLLTSPGEPWFILPMVAWGAVLALHAAYAMNLFGGLGGGGER